jgi:soluble lytic murein transglycosylase
LNRFLLLTVACLCWSGQTPARAVDQAPARPALTASDLWLVPSPEQVNARSTLAHAVGELSTGHAEQSLPVFAKATSDPVLGGYALLFMGRGQLALGRTKDATFTARQLLSVAPAPSPALAEAAYELAADAAETASDWSGAIKALQDYLAVKPTRSASLLLRLGHAAVLAGEKSIALQSYSRIYYEFALTPEARDAETEVIRIRPAALAVTPDTYVPELGRAERLFAARRYADARRSFDLLRPLATGEDRSHIDLRLAEADFHLKRYAAARDALRAILDRQAVRSTEAQYYLIGATRELGREDEYVALVRAFVDTTPEADYAESALNDLGTYYIVKDQDDKAAEVFAEQYRRFPQGLYADRAAWKAGWAAYRRGDYAETMRTFEGAAVTLRRADYRPAWLFWAARSHARVGQRDAAIALFRQVVGDYRNSYYGRQAAREIDAMQAASRPAPASSVAAARRELPATMVPGARPSNALIVQHLLAAGMYDEAIAELRRAQADAGSSPMIEATIAYALNRKGELRPGITAMRRAYPQFMASGGEAMPIDMLAVIFPIDYWSMIQRYATARGLDPYLMAALVAQESTFQADVRSSANAYGLMQIVPATGRRYAQTLGIRPFRTSRLTEAETNIRIGMAYFADLVRQFGHVVPALAAYNAGDTRVARWLDERPGLDREEFIDDIPFPETQNYVKRIIGTAEDYRRLYSEASSAPVRR